MCNWHPRLVTIGSTVFHTPVAISLGTFYLRYHLMKNPQTDPRAWKNQVRDMQHQGLYASRTVQSPHTFVLTALPDKLMTLEQLLKCFKVEEFHCYLCFFFFKQKTASP